MDFETRADRKPQGPRKLARERAAYLQLVSEGYGYDQAARIVGVNARTGRRWRNGRNPVGKHQGAPPLTAAEPPSQPPEPLPPSRYLREDDRILIADRRREGVSIRDIARELGRSPSTVSRELDRNAHPGTGDYRPHAAQRRCEERRPRPKTGKIGSSPELREFIQDRLELRWSPEQISKTLRKDFPDRPEMHVVHETIYQALYVQGRGELRRELTRALRTGRAIRKPRRQADRRQHRAVKNTVHISERPAEAADRAVPGHWEGDLITGKLNGSAIGTLVERSTRYVMLLHLPERHDASDFASLAGVG